MFQDLKRGPGEGPPTREVFNAMLDRLEGLVVQAGPGMLMRRSPGGTTLWPKVKNSGGSGDARQPFEVYGLRYDATATAWFCKVWPGYVLSINPSSASDAHGYWMPTAEDLTPLDAVEPPEIQVAAGDVLCVRIETTEKGIIEVAPTVVAVDEEEESIHSQPPNAEATGDFYRRLVLFEELALPEGSPPGAIPQLVVADIFHVGPIIHWPVLPEIKNIGGKREVFSTREPEGDTYDFRSLEQMPVEDGQVGAEIMVPAPEEGEGDTLKFRWFKKGNSGAVPYTISADGNAFKIQFTGLEGAADVGDGGSINFSAGIATSNTPPSTTGGWWGTRDYLTGGGTLVARTIFQAGKLISVFNASGGGAPIALPGTEMAPGYQAVTVT